MIGAAHAYYAKLIYAFNVTLREKENVIYYWLDDVYVRNHTL